MEEENKQLVDNKNNELDKNQNIDLKLTVVKDATNEVVSESEENNSEEEQKALSPQQMMNRFIPFKDMPVGTVFELSGLRMKKMEYARRPDSEEGFFNAIQLGIENGYMWVKEDNSFKVVPAHPKRNNNRNRRKKYGRNRSRGRNSSQNSQNNQTSQNNQQKPK